MAGADDLTYVTSLEEVSWGLALIAVTMIIHAVAMPATLEACEALRRRRPVLNGFFGGVRVLLLGSAMIAMAALLTFAWSTAVLLTLANRFQSERLTRPEHDG